MNIQLFCRRPVGRCADPTRRRSASRRRCRQHNKLVNRHRLRSSTMTSSPSWSQGKQAATEESVIKRLPETAGPYQRSRWIRQLRAFKQQQAANTSRMFKDCIARLRKDRHRPRKQSRQPSRRRYQAAATIAAVGHWDLTQKTIPYVLKMADLKARLWDRTGKSMHGSINKRL